MASDEKLSETRNTDRIVFAGLVGLCLLIYLQVLSFEFINLDDNLYVYDNQFVRAGINIVSLKWAVVAFHSANWHPLTWISHMIDATLFGPRAGWHHFVNVIFHAANSVLAYVVFKRLTGSVWRSAMVAALFAVHPAHVESVAWVSERKDVLSTLFWLLTILAYVRWVQDTGDVGRSVVQSVLSVRYLLVFLGLLLGLASKSMLVTLPFVLLLIDYWPLDRLNSIRDIVPRVVEKLPLFLLSVAACYVTVVAQSLYGAVASMSGIPLSTRMANAAVSYVKYIGMLFYPIDLGVNYVYQIPIPLWQIVGSVILLAVLTALCFWQRRERPYLIVGWLWFLGTMVPVIGIVQVGAQSLADRYTYVPYFGLFLMIVWTAAEFATRFKLSRTAMAVTGGAAILVLSVLAYQQTAHWRDSYSLYKRSIDSGYANFITYHNMCAVLLGRQMYAEAETNCLNAISAEPRFIEAYSVLGMLYAGQKRYEEAAHIFQRAIEIAPTDPVAYGNLAVPQTILGKTDEAERSIDKAVELYRARKANLEFLAVAYSNLAAVLSQQKDYARATDLLRRAVAIAPSRADIRANLALMLYFEGRDEEARTEIGQAVSMNPNSAEIQHIYGTILLKNGDNTGAARAFERAIELKPDLAQAKEDLEKLRKATK